MHILFKGPRANIIRFVYLAQKCHNRNISTMKKQTNITKGFFYILTTLFLISCGTATKIPADVVWEITKETPNDVTNTNSLNINLNKKVDEPTLKIIAGELRETRKQYDKLWIFYYLPNTSDDKVWATTYFNPDLTVDFVGASDPENQRLVDVEGDILGKWRSEVSMPGAILAIVEESDGQLHVLISIAGDIKMNSKVNESNHEGNPKYMDRESHGEFYVLESNGNLGLYNSNGKFDEAILIK
ncbi:MAG: hypothetical protein ACI8XB_003342 [Patiriisocius sp.]|jgi:hypothetical protein